MSNVPKLRFGEFDEKWTKVLVSEISTKLKVGFVGTCESSYTTKSEGIFLIRTGNLVSGKVTENNPKYVTHDFHLRNEKSQVFPGDILIARHGSNGQACIYTSNEEANCLNIVILRNDRKITDSTFILNQINSPLVHRQILARTAGSTQGVINTREIAGLHVSITSLSEQQKIAAFLNAVDTKIEQLTQKEVLLKQYKKGVMQKIFSQEIRFKADDGSEFPEWEEKRLSGVLNEHKSRSTGSEEVFSVSVHKGLVNQVEHLGRSFAASDTSNYNLVKPNDIVYTKSPTGDFPYGIIKQSRVDTDVLVSPLYGVFTPESVGLGYMLHVYFESVINTHNYLHSIIQKGAKNTINITNTTFTSKSLKLPTSRDEQNRIGKFLSTIDTKIDQNAQQLEAAKTFKKGLLQQMFV